MTQPISKLIEAGWTVEDAKVLQKLEMELERDYPSYLVSQAIADHIAKYGLSSPTEISIVRKHAYADKREGV